ncbi:MAG: TolC family protein [Pseudomonadota bacterium]
MKYPWIARLLLAAAALPLLGHAQGPVNQAAPVFGPAAASLLDRLVAEAVENNREIRAARGELDAARARVRPAGALDDPMLEAGVLNVPVESFSFRRDGMTMKMIGLAQKLPFPGKRDLREAAAAHNAESVAHAVAETVNRVVRDLKLAYYDLALVDESSRLARTNRGILQQFLDVSETRYAVGQTSQADVLKAQTQVSRMDDELLRLARERQSLAAGIARLLVLLCH